MERKGPNKVYVGLDEYGCADHVGTWPEEGYIEFIRKDAINEALKEFIMKSRPLPLSHLHLIEKIVKRLNEI